MRWGNIQEGRPRFREGGPSAPFMPVRRHKRILRISRLSVCASSGFARWPFMPASLALTMSSEKASAVIATIGTVRASARSIRRICRVASYPFIVGICTSIRIRS